MGGYNAFWKKQKKENVTIVRTKKELNEAVKMKKPCIEVEGNLVKHIKWMKKLSSTKVAALIALLASAAIPSPVAPISAVAGTSAVISITGVEIAGIIFAGGLSATMILSVLKNYNMEVQKGDTSLILTTK